MRFHEAVAAMAQGSCAKSQWGNIYKYDRVAGAFNWMNEKWMKDGFTGCETYGNWEIVADPSVKPLDFFGAMEALKAGKAVQSCDKWVYWKADNGNRMAIDTDGDRVNSWPFSDEDVSGSWLIVPIPEVTNV